MQDWETRVAVSIESGSLQTYAAVEAAGADIAVPDTDLLFTGDFSRSGTDLVLTGEGGAKFVVTGYFNSDSPPSLLSPQGAKLTGDVVTSLAGPQFPGQYAQAGDAPAGKEAIGQVQSLSGGATVVRANGITDTLNTGDPVFQGDVVQTGPGAKLGISFVDGTIFSLSANARMVLNSLIYDPDGSNNSMLFSLVEGAFVFAAGKIAPTGDMQINTPVATMGIRGTAPTIDINSQLGTVNFSIIPDPGDGHVGSYTLLNLDTKQPIGTISTVGTKWIITSATGEIVEIDKTQEDLLNDASSISQINNVFTQWQNSTLQDTDGPRAGPENSAPPSSSGLNTDPQNPGNTGGDGNNANPGGDGQNGGEGQNNGAPGNNPPPPPGNTGNDTPPPPPPGPPEATGPNIINGTEFTDVINGTPGVDQIFANGGNDFIFASAGNDIIDGGEGSDTLDYGAATQSVVINLVTGEVNSAEFGLDTIASLERFVGGSGDDTLIIGQDGPFFFDGNDGVDTILFFGGLNIDTATTLFDAENIEIIDLNKTDANTLTISADDFLDQDVGQLDQDGGQNTTIQIRGGTNADGTTDTLNLTGETFSGDYFGEISVSDGQFPDSGFMEGSWQKSDDTFTAEDGTVFDVYEFFSYQGGAPIATAQVEQGIDVNIQYNDPGTLSEGFENGFQANGWQTINAAISSINSTEGNSSARLSTSQLSETGPQNAAAISALTGVSVAALNALADDSAGPGEVTEGSAIATSFYAVAGQEISFDWFFSTTDYPNYNDTAFVSINGEAFKLYDTETSGNQIGNTTTEGWNSFSMVLDDSGEFTIAFGVLDDSDTAVVTDLLIDNILLGPVEGGGNTLSGGDGNDILIGGDGSDVLAGNGGDDTLTGGPGADKFVFNGLSDGIDTITDFGLQDTLDLTGLLQAVFDPDDPANSNIDDFVQAMTDGNGNTSVAVDVDGSANGANFTTIALLQGVGLGSVISVSIGDEDSSVIV